MAGEWIQATLGSIAAKDGYGLVDGPFGSNLPASCYTEHGIPVIRGSNLTLGTSRFRAAEFVFVSRETAQRLERSLCRPFDIVFTKKGTLGQTGLVPDGGPYDLYLLSSNQMKLTVDRRLADPLFVYYFVSTPESTQKIIQDSEATGVPKTNVTYLRDFPITLPPLPEQRAIAHILGALDDKIELNRRMNETLEAMARAIFKSWFVDFDPVHAKMEVRPSTSSGQAIPGLPKHLADLFPDSFEDCELGEIPKGWRAGRLDEVLAELVSGARPKGGAVNEGVPSIGAENVIGLGRYDFSKEKYVPQEFFEQLKLKGAAVRPGDVLLYKDGAQIGRKTYFDCDFPHAACAINEHVFILRANKPEEQRFLFFWLDQAWMTHEIISLNSNSAQPGINQTGVRRLPVIIPRHEVIRAFDQLITRLTKRLFANCNESRTLAALRDTLLPKLISGELRVKDAERFIGRVA